MDIHKNQRLYATKISGMSAFLAVFLGGGLGSLLRYGLSLLVVNKFSQTLPLATLLANVFACMLMALGFTIWSEALMKITWLKPFLLIGLCGGLSTFSTFSYENWALLKAGDYGWLIANIIISVVLCLLVFWFFMQKEFAE